MSIKKDLKYIKLYFNEMDLKETYKKERYKTFGQAMFNLKRILKEHNMYIQNVQIYDKYDSRLLYKIVV